MLNIGPQELLLILVVALMVVGPKRLPELGRSIGRGLRELRRAQGEVRRTLQESLDERPSHSKSQPRAGASQPTRTSEKSPEAEGGGPAETAETSEVSEISRTLGRSLAELRRAREEIQRTFRVDFPDDDVGPAPAPAPRTEEPDAG